MSDYKSVKLNTNIRKAATGGLVTSSTILNVGEAGTEAIIPLERNTAWMDMLASRINAGRGNGGNININVPGKALYTRADLLEIADMVNKAQMAYSN
jgi:SLT domain-containing protein